jgi:hypothetical protein
MNNVKIGDYLWNIVKSYNILDQFSKQVEKIKIGNFDKGL